MVPRSKFGAPMFETEVFRKQIYYIKESTCDIVETFRHPCGDSAPGKLCAFFCSPQYAPRHALTNEQAALATFFNIRRWRNEMLSAGQAKARSLLATSMFAHLFRLFLSRPLTTERLLTWWEEQGKRWYDDPSSNGQLSETGDYKHSFCDLVFVSQQSIKRCRDVQSGTFSSVIFLLYFFQWKSKSNETVRNIAIVGTRKSCKP